MQRMHRAIDTIECACYSLPCTQHNVPGSPPACFASGVPVALPPKRLLSTLAMVLVLSAGVEAVVASRIARQGMERGRALLLLLRKSN